MSNENGKPNWSDIRGRPILTLVISIGGLVLILALAIVVLCSNGGPNDNKLETSKWVFGAVLPLIASWIGTVMAYYFSRDNFVAATQSVSALAQNVSQRLAGVLARDKMRLVKDATTVTLTPDDDKTYKLSQLLTDFAKVDRAIILRPGGALGYIVHKSMVERFLAAICLGTKTVPQGTTTANLSLADMLNADPETKRFATEAVGFIPITATLADAKSKMESIAKCQDVFVTQTGSKDEPILGWITDNRIAENSRLN